MVEEIKKNRYAFVIAVACCMCVFGGAVLVFACAGVFYVPLGEHFGVGRGSISIYISIVSGVMAFTMPVMGRFAVKWDIRQLVLLCMGAITISFIAFAFAPNLWVIYIAAALQGFGVAGPMYIIVPTMINRWFQKKAGTFIGVAMAFTGGSAIILMPIIAIVIQNFGWRIGYGFEAALCLIFMGIPALFMFKNTPETIGLKPYGYEAAAEGAANGASNPIAAAVSLKTAMKSSTFYILAVLAGAISFITDINFFWTAYATELGYGLVVASLIGSVAMYGQVVGKIGLGIISDKFLKLSMVLSYAFGLVGMGGALILGGSAGTVLILVFIFLYGMTHAACAVETPIIARNAFGAGKDYAQIYANVMSVGAFCSMIGTTLFGYIIDWTGGYDAVFIIGVVLCIICLVAAFAALSTSKKLPRDSE
jgi:MFS family permease